MITVTTARARQVWGFLLIYYACMASSYCSVRFNSLSTTFIVPKTIRPQIQKQNAADRTNMASLDSEDLIAYPQIHYQIPIAVPIMPIFGNVVGNSIYSPRVQRIKDLSLQKDILRDVTASEFALRVEMSTPDPQDSNSGLIINHHVRRFVYMSKYCRFKNHCFN